MYSFIINPLTNKRVNINSKLGEYILNNYIIQLGGSTLGNVVKKSKPILFEKKKERPKT